MKRLLLIVLPLLLIVGCSQKPVDETTLIGKDGVMYLPNSAKPYTGEVFTNYSTGEKFYQGTYDNGLLIQYSYLNKDGSVKEPINFDLLITRGELLYEVNGQKPYTGDVFGLHNNGNRSRSGSLKGGKLHDEWIEWYENGQMLIKEMYVGGLKNGSYNSWFENGQKWTEGTFKNGKEVGLVTRWYENGNIKETINYSLGLKNGPYQYYISDGTLRIKGQYSNDEVSGSLEYFFPSGTKLSTQKFVSNSVINLTKNTKYDMGFKALTFNNLKNIVIEGNGSEIYVPSAYMEVVDIVGSENIIFNNITIGHRVDGLCSEPVVFVTESNQIIFNNCDLYGSGYVGIIGRSSQIIVNNSIIRETESNICEGYQSDFKFNKTIFKDCNKGFSNHNENYWTTDRMSGKKAWGGIFYINNCEFIIDKFNNSQVIDYNEGVFSLKNSIFNGTKMENIDLP
jgi:antitoxin component YwqK of YwqJK toxin-antitoxin module